jgi:hypothetical protein
MQLPQGQGLGIEGVVGGPARSWLIGGLEVGVGVREALQEMANGAWTQVQRASDDGGGLAAACALLDEATHRQRKRSRHGRPRTKKKILAIAYSGGRSAAKPLCRD